MTEPSGDEMPKDEDVETLKQEAASLVQNNYRRMNEQERELYERTVIDGMKRLRKCRKKAEKRARMVVKQFRKTGVIDEPPKDITPKPKRAPVKMSRAEIAKLPPVNPPRPPPRNAKERLERALGPDDGRRRRGGSPVVQGGSPGLGKRC